MIKRRRRDGCVHVSWDTDYCFGQVSLLLPLLDSVVAFDITPWLMLALLVVVAPAFRSANRLRPQIQHSARIYSIEDCYFGAAP